MEKWTVVYRVATLAAGGAAIVAAALIAWIVEG